MPLPEPQNPNDINIPEEVGDKFKLSEIGGFSYHTELPNTTFTMKDLEKIIKDHVNSEAFLHQIHEELTYALLYGHSKNKHCKREFYGLEKELDSEDYVDLPWKDGDYQIDRVWLRPETVHWTKYVNEDASPSEMLTVTEYRLKEIEDLGDMWIARYYR